MLFFYEKACRNKKETDNLFYIMAYRTKRDFSHRFFSTIPPLLLHYYSYDTPMILLLYSYIGPIQNRRYKGSIRVMLKAGKGRN